MWCSHDRQLDRVEVTLARIERLAWAVLKTEVKIMAFADDAKAFAEKVLAAAQAAGADINLLHDKLDAALAALDLGDVEGAKTAIVAADAGLDELAANVAKPE